MPDVKISNLPAATTPLIGTEVLPIVQNTTTKKVSIDDVTTGRAVTVASINVSTGNVIIGTAGKGIDFSANPNPSGMTSELLNDYEEGTWNPTIVASVSGTAVVVASGARYTKIGRLVLAVFDVQINNATSLSGNLSLGGLPFARETYAYISGTTNISVFLNLSTSVINITALPVSGGTTATLFKTTTATTNSVSSALTAADCTNNLRIAGTIVYNT